MCHCSSAVTIEGVYHVVLVRPHLAFQKLLQYLSASTYLIRLLHNKVTCLKQPTHVPFVYQGPSQTNFKYDNKQLLMSAVNDQPMNGDTFCKQIHLIYHNKVISLIFHWPLFTSLKYSQFVIYVALLNKTSLSNR